MKLPNGYGSITKLKGRRRNPWAVRKTTGLTDDGKAIVKYVGYYATRADALAALAAYNKFPYRGITMNELFDKWANECGAAASTMQTYRYAYKHIGRQGDRDMNHIKLDDLQPIFDGLTLSTAKALKTVVSGLYAYAVRHEYVAPERAAIAQYIRIPERKHFTITRSVFTAEEIASCTDHAVRVLLYTGMRISELLNLTDDCVHLEERYLEVRQAKTRAGVRKVPIAERIVDDVAALDCLGMDYYVFRRHHFHYSNHTVHDTRHTFISLMANLDPPVDERVTKAIVGHAGSGITETVYTHLDLETLKNAVNRL